MDSGEKALELARERRCPNLILPVLQTSMSLKYEPSSELLHIAVLLTVGAASRAGDDPSPLTINSHLQALNPQPNPKP